MDYLRDAVALGIDTFIFGMCLRHYFHYKNAHAAVKGAEFHEVSGSLSKVLDNSTDNKVDYIAIKGTVKPIGEPLHSLSNKDVTGVIQKLVIKEHVVAKTSSGFWSDQERALQKVHNTVPFVLKKGIHQVEVLDPLAADILDMDVTADHFEPAIPTLSDHLWGMFTGIRQKGIQSTEEILREGAVMVGIGELSRSAKNPKILTLQPPMNGAPFYLTNMSITTLLHKLEGRRKIYGWLCLMCGAVGLVIGGIIIRRYWKNKEEQRVAEELRQSLAASRRSRRQRVRDQQLREDQLCVVCCTNPREIILLPCGHVCLCEDCSDGVVNGCPLCREHIVQKAAAYII